LDLQPGSRVGGYEVVALVGRGGSGTVYRGRTSDGREVALKVLESRFADARARFARERRLLATLGEREGFVPLLDADPEGAFIVMPFVAGGTLRARLAKGPLGVEETVALGRSLALALGRAHARGIVHRDVKPENVLFDAVGTTPLLADLGLAKHFRADTPGASVSVQLSASGDLRGTFGYMPVEQMRGSKRVGPSVDVFALGAILYECLAGVPPYVGATLFELMDVIEREKFMRLRELRREVPQAVAAAIERALARDPGERFADGSAFAAALGASVESRPRDLRRGAAFAMMAMGLAAALAGALVVGRGPVRPEVVPGTVDPPRGTSWRGVVAALPSPVRALAFAELDGNSRLLVGGDDRVLHVIDTSTAKELLAVPMHAPIRDLAAGGAGLPVLVGLANGVAESWELRAPPHELASCQEHTAGVSVALGPEGVWAVSVGEEGQFRSWDPSRPGPSVLHIKILNMRPGFVIPRDSSAVAYGGVGDVGIIDIAHPDAFIRNSGARRKEPTTGGAFFSGPLADRHWLATVGEDGTLAVQNSLLEVLASSEAARLRGRMWIRALPDGSLVTCASDGECQQWFAVGGELHMSFVRGQAVSAVSHPSAFTTSPDGRLLAVGGADGTVKLFDLSTRPWREAGPRSQ